MRCDIAHRFGLRKFRCGTSGSASGHVVLAWLLGKSSNIEELFKAELLTAVLMDNSGSPLLAALETSDLGASPSPMCGLEDSNREMSFMAGLEGCAPGTTDAVETLVIETLEAIVEKGIDQEHILAALHQLRIGVIAKLLVIVILMWLATDPCWTLKCDAPWRPNRAYEH